MKRNNYLNIMTLGCMMLAPLVYAETGGSTNDNGVVSNKQVEQKQAKQVKTLDIWKALYAQRNNMSSKKYEALLAPYIAAYGKDRLPNVMGEVYEFTQKLEQKEGIGLQYMKSLRSIQMHKNKVVRKIMEPILISMGYNTIQDMRKTDQYAEIEQLVDMVSQYGKKTGSYLSNVQKDVLKLTELIIDEKLRKVNRFSYINACRSMKTDKGKGIALRKYGFYADKVEYKPEKSIQLLKMAEKHTSDKEVINKKLLQLYKRVENKTEYVVDWIKRDAKDFAKYMGYSPEEDKQHVYGKLKTLNNKNFFRTFFNQNNYDFSGDKLLSNKAISGCHKYITEYIQKGWYTKALDVLDRCTFYTSGKQWSEYMRAKVYFAMGKKTGQKEMMRQGLAHIENFIKSYPYLSKTFYSENVGGRRVERYGVDWNKVDNKQFGRQVVELRNNLHKGVYSPWYLNQVHRRYRSR